MHSRHVVVLANVAGRPLASPASLRSSTPSARRLLVYWPRYLERFPKPSNWHPGTPTRCITTVTSVDGHRHASSTLTHCTRPEDTLSEHDFMSTQGEDIDSQSHLQSHCDSGQAASQTLHIGLDNTNGPQWALHLHEGSHEDLNHDWVKNTSQILERLAGVDPCLDPGSETGKDVTDLQVRIDPRTQLAWLKAIELSPVPGEEAYQGWKRSVISRPDLWTWSTRQTESLGRRVWPGLLRFRRGCEEIVARHRKRATDSRPESTEDWFVPEDYNGTVDGPEGQNTYESPMLSGQHYMFDDRAKIWTRPFLEILDRAKEDSSSRDVSLQQIWWSVHANVRGGLWAHMLLYTMEYHPEHSIAVYNMMQASSRRPNGSPVQLHRDAIQIPRYTFLYALLIRMTYGDYDVTPEFRSGLLEFVREDPEIFFASNPSSNRTRMNMIMRCIIALADDPMILSVWTEWELRFSSTTRYNGATTTTAQSENTSKSELSAMSAQTPPVQVTCIRSWTMLHVAYRLALARQPSCAMQALRVAIQLGHSPEADELIGVAHVILQCLANSDDSQASAMQAVATLSELGIPLTRALINVLMRNAALAGNASAVIELHYTALENDILPNGLTYAALLQMLRTSHTEPGTTRRVLAEATSYAIENRDIMTANAILSCTYSIIRAEVRSNADAVDTDTSGDLDLGRQIWERLCQTYTKLFNRHPLEALGIWPSASWFVDEDDDADTAFDISPEEATWEGRMQTARTHDDQGNGARLLDANAATVTIMLQARLLCVDQPHITTVQNLFDRFWSLVKIGSQQDTRVARVTDEPHSSNALVMLQAAQSPHIWSIFVVAAGRTARPIAGESREAPAFAFSVLRSMTSGGTMPVAEPGEHVFASLLHLCNQHNQPAAGEMVERMMASRGLKKGQFSWSAVVRRYAEGRDFGKAIESVASMRSEGFDADSSVIKSLRMVHGTAREQLDLMLSSEALSRKTPPSLKLTRAATAGSRGGTGLGYTVDSEFFSAKPYSVRAALGLEGVGRTLSGDEHLTAKVNKSRGVPRPDNTTMGEAHTRSEGANVAQGSVSRASPIASSSFVGPGVVPHHGLQLQGAHH